MSELKEHIKLISVKLQQLLKQHEQLHADNNRLKQTIDILQKKEDSLKAKVEILEQQQLILKATSEPLNESDKKAMEKKINAYLRDIDKCISLLTQ